jgi:hypothetical protein
LLEGFENRWLDMMASIDRPQFDAPIAVVTITDADYYDPALFHGMSPLHPDMLARVLKSVLDHRPVGVVLDVQIHPAAHETDERGEARQGLYRLVDSTSAAGGPPIVLVRDLEAERRELSSRDTKGPAWESMTSNSRLIWADPSIGRSDGYVRSVPCYHGDEEGKVSPTPTILGAAILTFGLVPRRVISPWIAEEAHPMSPWRIRFSGRFLEDTTFVTPYRTDVRALLSTPVVEGQRSLLTDRIVLIGGTYYAGRDFHPTVVGSMAGVYVWAEAIASWIRHDAVRGPRESITFALEFLVGVVAGLLLIRFGPALGLLYCLLLVGPLTVFFSLLTFGDRVLFVSFLPSFVGVYLHYQIEVHREIRHLRGRLRRAESALGEERSLPASVGGRSGPHDSHERSEPGDKSDR